MTMISREIAVTVALVLHVMCVYAESIPRLWQAEGDKGRFYLLAIAHTGSPMQYDSYLSDVVLPKYDKANAFFFEYPRIATRATSPCLADIDLISDPYAKEVIAFAREKVLTRRVASLRTTVEIAPQAFSSITNIEQFINDTASRDVKSMTDFDLQLSFFDSDGQASKHARPAAVNIQKEKVHSPIIDFLRERDPKQGKRPSETTPMDIVFNESKWYTIETVDDWRNAYCAVGGSRWRIIADSLASEENGAFQQATSNPSDESQTQADELMEKILQAKQWQFRELYAGGTVTNRESAQYVCNRSRLWIDRMMNLQKTYGNVFYALGVAHIFDAKDGDFECPGVLTLLSQRGYRVKLLGATKSQL